MPKQRVHFFLADHQILFLEQAFSGISKSEALRRVIDEGIQARGWKPPVATAAETEPQEDTP